MAVTSVNLKISGRGGTRARGGMRSYSQTWIVKTNDVHDGPLVARTAAGLPIVGITTYVAGNDADPSAVCVSLDPEQHPDNPKFWEVRAEYSSIEAGRPGQEGSIIYPARPPIVRWGGAQFTRPVDKDKDGLPVRNSADEDYDPAPERDDSRMVLTVERNQLAYDELLSYDYRDAVNSDTFLGKFPPRSAKLAPITAEQQWEQGFTYWRVNYEIHFRKELFDFQIVDKGYHEKVPAALVAQKFRYLPIKVDGEPTPIAVALDGNGKPLPPGSPPVYRTFRVYPEKPFAPLGLP